MLQYLQLCILFSIKIQYNFLVSTVIYKFTCECDVSDAYICMTSQHLMTRIEEYLNEGLQCNAVIE